MTTFNSIGGLASHLAKLAINMEANKAGLLEHVGRHVEKAAKELNGQENVQGVGGFSTWAPLAESTIEEKEKLGYVGQVSATDPLLRTGEMRDSIVHIVDVPKSMVVVGSASAAMLAQELGTQHIPPRSELGIAAVNSEKDLQKFAVEYCIAVFKS